MSDFTAVPYVAPVSQELATSWASDVRAFAKGTLFAAVITILGAIAVVVALMVGVVAAPLVAAAVAYAVHRHGRARAIASTRSSPART